MQALRFEKTGSFDELALQTIAKPSLAPGEALVRVKAAGINGVSSLPLSRSHSHSPIPTSWATHRPWSERRTLTLSFYNVGFRVSLSPFGSPTFVQLVRRSGHFGYFTLCDDTTHPGSRFFRRGRGGVGRYRCTRKRMDRCTRMGYWQ